MGGNVHCLSFASYVSLYRTTIWYNKHVPLPHSVQKKTPILSTYYNQNCKVQCFDCKTKITRISALRLVVMILQKFYFGFKNTICLCKNRVINKERLNQLPEDNYLNTRAVSVKEGIRLSGTYDCVARNIKFSTSKYYCSVTRARQVKNLANYFFIKIDQN